MPLCQMRMAPVIYAMCLYAAYMLIVFPALEVVGYGLKVILGYELGHSMFTMWIYWACLVMFVPCYAGMFWFSWRKHRAKPLFTPKWKTDEPLVEDDVQCTICYDLIVDPRTLRCQHSFCAKCIDQCLPLTRRCPSCQQWVYWSNRNKMFRLKVLEWVKENERGTEYEEVVEMKKNIQLKKLGFWERVWPMILPFFEIPIREDRRERRLRRPLHPLADPAPLRAPDSMVVNVIDEEDEEDQEADVVSANPPVAALHIPLPTIHECPEPSASSDNLQHSARGSISTLSHAFSSSSTASASVGHLEDSTSNITASSSSASFVTTTSHNEPIDV